MRHIKVKPPRKPVKSKPAKARPKVVRVKAWGVFAGKLMILVEHTRYGAEILKGWCGGKPKPVIRPITITYRKARP